MLDNYYNGWLSDDVIAAQGERNEVKIFGKVFSFTS